MKIHFIISAYDFQIDTQALQVQIDEKKKKELELKRIDSIFENQLNKADQIAVTLEQKQREVLTKVIQTGILFSLNSHRSKRN